MLGHKVSLCKFKKTEIVSGIFSDNNMLLNNNDHWRNQSGKKKNPETNENKSTMVKTYGME